MSEAWCEQSQGLGSGGKTAGNMPSGGFFPEDSYLLRLSCEFIWLFSLWALGLTVVPKD